ncbi:MAG: hypothetical protein ACI95K_001843 [Lentimonas sp.]|jgi:hypothetical protein
MNKKPILLSVLVLVGTSLLSSCTSSRFRIKSSDYQEINKGSIQQVNKIADYNVDLIKVIASYEDQTGYNASTSRQSIENAKQFAIAAAIEKAKCDFLVNPLFDIEVAGSFIKVTVDGYPAKYTEFKTVETVIVPQVEEATRNYNPLQDLYNSKK